MSAFRKRSQRVITSSRCDAHFVTNSVGDNVYVTQHFEPVPSEQTFANPSPTLDQQLNAGVAVKEVNIDGILDSYDVNDTPLQELEKKIVTKGRKTKKTDNPDNVES